MNKTVPYPLLTGPRKLTVTIIEMLDGGRIVTVARIGPQITACKVKLVADCLIADCVGKTFDCIALPGGMPGAEYLRDNAVLTELLKQQDKAKRVIAAICAAPAVVLAHHGLLKGRKATCYPSAQDALPIIGGP
jgi:4-methyl-5(b-hydroxyethyl)-thiazole monophosphate biosynthesis